MGVKYPCIHGDLCRAYMRKFGWTHIYDYNCPNCRFYEPDYRFECDDADYKETTMSVFNLFNRKQVEEVKENDSPPCITCIHCVVEEEYDYTGYSFNVHKCDLTPSDSGVMFAPCSKARKTKFCKYEGDCRVARYLNQNDDKINKKKNKRKG